MTANSPQPAKCLIHPCGNRAEIAGLCVACYRSAWNRAAGPRLPGGDPPQAGEEQPATDPLSRYAAIQRQRRQLEGRLRALKQEACELEQSILDDWADRGRRKAAVDGLCVFVRAEMYCSKRPDISGPEMARVLVQLGLGRMVGHSAAGLRRYVQQRLAAAKQSQGIESDDDIPLGIDLDAALSPELAAIITVGETVRLRTRLVR